MDRVTRQCPQNHNLFEEKGEPKRFRTEVLPLTSRTPYRLAKPAYEFAIRVTRSAFSLTAVVWLSEAVLVAVTKGDSGHRFRYVTLTVQRLVLVCLQCTVLV